MADAETYRIGFPEVIRKAVKHEVATMRVAMPGTIVSYDASEQSASVQPAWTLSTGEKIPVITRAPVQFPRGGGFAITLPLAAGDPCWLLFGERDLERWLTTGQKHPPQSSRRFDWSDAVVIPGVGPWPDALASADASDLVVGRDDGTGLLRINPSGGITLGNENSGVELLDLLDQLITKLQLAKTITGIGPQPFDLATINALSQIRASLQGIKG